MSRDLPDLITLRRWYDEEPRLSAQQMADRLFEQTGVRVTRHAFSAAWARNGFPPRNLRHNDLLPANMRLDHQKLYDTEMIRRFSARRQGKVFDEKEEQRINSWLLNLRDAKVVLVYRRDTQKGWHPVKRRPTDDPDLPVRLPKRNTKLRDAAKSL